MATFVKRGKRWRCEIRRKGVYRSKTAYTKGELEAWARQVETDIDQGKGGAHPTATLREAFNRYSREVSSRKKGCRWEQIRLAKICRDPLADVWLRNLSAAHIADFRDRRATDVLTSSVNRELTLISSVISVARDEWGWIDENPARKVKRLPGRKPRDRRISDDEIAMICAQLGYDRTQIENRPTTKSQEVAVMFLLAIETGMRLGEIAGLQPDDILLEKRFVIVRDSKNSDKRHVPLTKTACRLLKALKGRKWTVSASSASAMFYRAKVEAKIPDLTFHDTRHEAMTRLARKLDVLDLARMVGVRDPRTLMIYYNPTPTEIASRLD